MKLNAIFIFTGIFSKLVNDNEIKPLTGILDAANKGWYWAHDLLELLQNYDLNLILIQSTDPCNVNTLQDKTIRFTLPCSQNDNLYNLHALKNVMERQKNVDLMNATLVRNNQQCGTLKRWQNSNTLPPFFKSSDNLMNDTIKHSSVIRKALCLSHSDVRDLSPMTRILESSRRYGQHRCLGDLTESLVALNKLSVIKININSPPTLSLSGRIK